MSRPAPDPLLTAIADYLVSPLDASEEAAETARLCLLDALGCAFAALAHPECTKLLGPVVPGTRVPHGARVPGTPFVLDPVKAAFDLATMIRWLDFNDTWLAAEWGHPSDNLGAVLATADWRARRARAAGEPVPRMEEVLEALIKAYEIQGVLALDNAFNRVGLDHVILVKLASCAVCTRLLGGGREEIVDALSQVWVDGHPLRTYRHFPNAGPRKSWAAGDAAGRAVQLALLTLAGEIGCPTALSAPRWGFQEALFGGREVRLSRPLAGYVIENILFKVAYPAEFHAQTAVEAALALHPAVRERIGGIERITIRTQEAAVRIIDKKGPLHNPADRDHCLQYMVAVPLLFGRLTARDYEDEVAADPRIDALRARMEVTEDPAYTAAYHDPGRRAIPNALRVFFGNGDATEEVEILYPLGHRRRRREALPHLEEKFRGHLAACFPRRRRERILEATASRAAIAALPVDRFVDLFVP